MPEKTVATLLARARNKLAGATETARLDSEVLLAAALAKPRSHLYAWPESHPGKDAMTTFESWVEARLQGQPVAYLTGEREFWSLTLKVTPDTLIPRPETELLVELTLARLPVGNGCTVVDLGTGSGAVALALARERLDAWVMAVDISEAALMVARANASRHGLDNLCFLESDWFRALPTDLRADAIVANPPYVAAQDPHLTRGDPRFEPRTALVAREDGLQHLRQIVANAPSHLRQEGWLLLEHGHEQASAVRGFMRNHGYAEIVTRVDFGGRDRVTLGRWRG